MAFSVSGVLRSAPPDAPPVTVTWYAPGERHSPPGEPVTGDLEAVAAFALLVGKPIAVSPTAAPLTVDPADGPSAVLALTSLFAPGKYTVRGDVPKVSGDEAGVPAGAIP